MTAIKGAAAANALMQATIPNSLQKKKDFEADQESSEESQKNAEDPTPVRATSAPNEKREAPPKKSSKYIDITV